MIDEGTLLHEHLTSSEQQLHRSYHNGKLEHAMKVANKAFGHGVGATPTISIEQMATLAIEEQMDQ